MKSRKGLIKLYGPLGTALALLCSGSVFHGRVQGPSLPPGHSRHVMEIWPVPTKTKARFVLLAFCSAADRTAPLRRVQGCSHPACQSRIHLQPWEHCSSPRKIGRHFSVPCPKCRHMGFAEHRGLSGELAGPWNRWLVVNPLSKTAGGWRRAQMATKASIFLQ